jgi:vancomycin resistance protein VanJ
MGSFAVRPRPRPGRRRLGLVAALCAVYALGMLGWHALRFTPVGGWWPFEVVDIFAVWAYLAVPPLLLLALLARSRPAVLWLGATVALFAWDYGWLFLPRSAPTARAETTSLRVMTANLLVVNGDLDGIAASILAEAPDVVAIQELGYDQAGFFATRLSDRYPHQVLEPNGAPWGLGVISRYPLTREGPAEPAPNACACQRLRVDLGGRAFTLLNVHPPPPSIGWTRLGPWPAPGRFDAGGTEATLRLALEQLDGVTGPVVVLGDFNTGDRQPSYRALRRRFGDAHRAAGWGFGFTFPNLPLGEAPAVPLVRIDYVMHDAAWTAAAARTGTIPGSDHRYVAADLILR